MTHKCDLCNRDFDSDESLKQHSLAKHANKEPKKINFKKYFVFTAIILAIIFLSLSVNSYMKRPGQYNDFAKCLTEKGAVIYGNDFCSYTAQQLNFFGKSKEYLNYVKCINNEELCNNRGISVTPTWEINGESYSGVQTFKRLSAITGCNLS